MYKYGIKDIYKFYKGNSSNPVDYTLFVEVWKDFADTITSNIVSDGKDFTMPFRVGTIGIRKKKIKITVKPDGTIDKRYLRPDWKTTKQLWERDKEAAERKQLIFHLNKHFNGFNCKWFWDKSTCSVPNQSAYSLVMSRENKRKLAKIILDETKQIDYYEQIPKISWKKSLERPSTKKQEIKM